MGVKSVQQESRISISRFIDEITANINALNSLNLPVNTFEIILIHYLAQKLDNYTLRLWKESLSEERFPNFSNFIKFLNTRRQLLQNLDSATTSTSKINVGDKAHYRKAIKTVNVSKSTFHTHVGNNICQLCEGKHRLTECSQFITITPQAVSYTHLDVYKRQHTACVCFTSPSCGPQAHHSSIYLPDVCTHVVQ